MSKRFQIETGENNTILREKSTPVHPRELSQYVGLANDMVKYVKNPENGGVGLAAPQVGVNKRIIAISLMHTYDDEEYRTIAMINPEIVEHSEEMCLDEEGCLSVPGEKGEVSRWKSVKVNFLDTKGIKYSLKLTELSARIIQHEIDHLNGVLFTDKVESGSLVFSK
ncbi:peptide deformylase [Candidatus Gracilibacteria bacterium]|nr:peptide deformylase [Candidatus Gracilibacteria bacterium]